MVQMHVNGLLRKINVSASYQQDVFSNLERNTSARVEVPQAQRIVNGTLNAA